MTIPPQEQTGKWFACVILCQASIASLAPILSIQHPYCMLHVTSLCGYCFQAFVAVSCKPVWLLLSSLCGCFLQAFEAVSCKPLWLLLSSLCGCLLQAFVAVAFKPLWLLLSSLCGCFLQAYVAVSQHPVRLFLASLCGCFLQTCLAVSCKPLWLLFGRLCGCLSQGLFCHSSSFLVLAVRSSVSFVRTCAALLLKQDGAMCFKYCVRTNTFDKAS